MPNIGSPQESARNLAIRLGWAAEGVGKVAAMELGTIGGRPVTQELIEAWAEEAEKGYDVEKILENRKHGLPSSFEEPQDGKL